jgi:hypothetical protein
MANITITPTGAAFNPTDTVTSTRLNEARNPTAALTTGSIVPTDLSTGAPNWDSSGTLNVIGNLASSSIFTSGEAIEINQSGTGDRNAYVDFHTADPSGTDFNARIYRSGGLDSDFQILNSGTGSIVVNSTIAQINNNGNSITTKDYVNSAIQSAVQATQASIYPVGSIYINATDATNPVTLLGFGTWIAFGAGRVPVGIDASQVEFDTAGKTGGSKDAVVVEHTHTTPANILFGNQSSGGNNIDGPGTVFSQVNTNQRETESTGVSGTNKNLQPYVVVYMWTRTA